MTKIIAIASGKGGVGKTTTAINLGCALTSFGKDIVVVDGNLGTPHVALHLGSSKLPLTLNDALAGKAAITDTAYLHPSGLRIIPSSISPEAYSQCNVGRLRETLLGLAGTTEVVLLDIGAGMSKETVQELTAADEVMIVTTPDMLAVSDAMKTIKIAKDAGLLIHGIVLNKVTDNDAELSSANVASLLEHDVLGIVPEDHHVHRALSMKQPVVHSHPDSPAAIGYKKLAAAMLGQNYEPKGKQPEESTLSIVGLRQKLGIS